MLESPAYRILSRAAFIVMTRLEIAHSYEGRRPTPTASCGVYIVTWRSTACIKTHQSGDLRVGRAWVPGPLAACIRPPAVGRWSRIGVLAVTTPRPPRRAQVRCRGSRASAAGSRAGEVDMLAAPCLIRRSATARSEGVRQVIKIVHIGCEHRSDRAGRTTALAIFAEFVGGRP